MSKKALENKTEESQRTFFIKKVDGLGKKYKQASLPPIIKLSDFPEGEALEGKFIALEAKENQTKKYGKYSALIILELLIDKTKVALPCKKVLQTALKVEGIEDGKPVSPLIGKDVVIYCKGKAGKGKQEFWNFEVHIQE